jgi:hypothetical protein
MRAGDCLSDSFARKFYMAAAMLADAFGITHALFQKQKTPAATRLFGRDALPRASASPEKV